MSFLYERFGSTYAGGEVLPLFDGTEPLGSGPVPSPILQLPGGSFWDTLGAGQGRQGSRQITLKGDWIAASAGAMETKIDALTALVGTRSYLWKSNDGGTTTRSILARCLAVRTPTGPGSPLVSQFEMDFVLEAELWRGAYHSETTTLDTSPHAVVTTNAGNARVRNAIITMATDTANTITEIGVSITGKVDWHWTGTLEAGVGVFLVVNCGTRRVTYLGVDAYAGFALQAAQAESDWLPLDPGVNTIAVHFTGSAQATFKLEYYDGWN
jgi:hypothetical protein